MSESPKSNIVIWLAVPIVVLGILLAALIAANRPPPVPKMPSVVLPKPNGWDDLVKATEFDIRPFGPYSDADRRPEEWTAAQLTSWMHKRAAALAMVRKALSQPCVRPPENPLATVFWTGAGMRELGRTITGEALYYRVIGKPERAAESLLDCVEVGIVVQQGGGLIRGFTGSAIQGMALYDIDPVLPKLSPTDLAQFADRMVRINAKQVPYSDMLVEEGQVNAAMWSDAFRTGNRLAVAFDWDGTFIPQSKVPATTPARMEHSIRFAFINKTRMIEENRAYLRALAKEQKGPYTGTSHVPIPRNPIADMYPDMYVKSRFGFTRNEAIFAVLQTEVALRRYRAVNHRYPDRISELVPTYVKSMPIDPFGLGKALKYTSTKNGRSFLLYSVGPDMKDNGGTPITGQYVIQSSIGDIVAGKLAAKP